MQQESRSQKLAASILPPLKRYYRVDEVAEYFAVSERTIYRMIYTGEIKTIRIRDCIRISVEEMRAFEERAIATEDDY
jgi:excisionase family DNA binding protein